MDKNVLAADDKQYWIDCIISALQYADERELSCIYQFVLHIVK